MNSPVYRCLISKKESVFTDYSKLSKKIRYLNISCFQIIFNERNWMETNILEICTKSFTSKSRDNDEKKLLEDEIPFYTIGHTDTFFLS